MALCRGLARLLPQVRDQVLVALLVQSEQVETDLLDLRVPQQFYSHAFLTLATGKTRQLVKLWHYVAPEDCFRDVLQHFEVTQAELLSGLEQ